MILVDFLSKTIPVHRLFEYSGGSKTGHLKKFVI